MKNLQKSPRILPPADRPAARSAWDGLPLWLKVALLLAMVIVLVVLMYLVLRDPGLAAPRLVQQIGGEAPAIGARGPVTLAFAEPMLPESVESRLSFSPALKGHFTWDDASGQAVSFWPDRPLQPGQRIAIHLAAGARSKNGREQRQAKTYQVEVRQAEVLYLSPSQASELWEVSSNGKDPLQLTNTGGRIIDYGVSWDGAKIAYAVKNEQQGIDLWEMDRQGAAPHLLLPCGTDWCTSPAYSPDGKQVVYSRRKVSGLPGRQPENPHLWTIDPPAKTTAEMFADPGIGGSRAIWSPDGRFLAFYDELSGGVRVYDAQARTDFLVPAAEGTGVEWYPDSTALLYLQAGVSGDLPYSFVYQVNVKNRQVQRVLGEDDSAEDYSVPAWAADGEWAAVGQRLAGGSLTRQLWLVRLGNGQAGSERQAITSDVMYNHAGYQWEPGGSRLVFQRLAYGASDSLPQIVLWNRQDRQTLLLAEDGYQPNWLP